LRPPTNAEDLVHGRSIAFWLETLVGTVEILETESNHHSFTKYPTTKQSPSSTEKAHLSVNSTEPSNGTKATSLTITNKSNHTNINSIYRT